MNFVLSLFAASTILSLVSAFFDINSNSNVALYWGQNTIGSQTGNKVSEQNLTYYCENDQVDIVLLSFLSHFPGENGVPTLTFHNYEFSSQYQSELTGLADQIRQCQAKDKLVLLSLGGEGTGYGFQEDSEGTAFASKLWNMFGPKNASTNSSEVRPFGDVLINGFDLDAENHNETGYINLLYTLGQYANNTKTSGEKFYLSVAPQCPSTDNNLADVLGSNFIDFAFIQFYNNPENCNANTDKFNWQWWAGWAANQSRNKDIKLFLGTPGSSGAAANGYFSNSTQLGEKVYQASRNSSFGGVSIYDASTAFNNNDTQSGNFLDTVKAAFSYKPPVVDTSSNKSATSTSSSRGAAFALSTSHSLSLTVILFSLLSVF